MTFGYEEESIRLIIEILQPILETISDDMDKKDIKQALPRMLYLRDKHNIDLENN